MFKIYFNQKPLIVTGALTNELGELKNKPGTVVLEKFSPDAATELVQGLQNNMKTGIIIDKDEEETKKFLKQMFTVIPAAGGLVITPAQACLLIFRKGKWDLPKGKLDSGETLEDCAVREVQEETGIKNIALGKKLTTTYHTYFEKELHILKESHWYLMPTQYEVKLKPQTEEGIELCEWVHVDHLPDYFTNMHPSIIDVLEMALPIVKQE